MEREKRKSRERAEMCWRRRQERTEAAWGEEDSECEERERASKKKKITGRLKGREGAE